MITPTSSFNDNLQLLPSIEEVAHIDIIDLDGKTVDRIENQPGKQGSLIVYQYLERSFGTLNVQAALHGLEVFAEHTEDAKNRPGAHPNIDRLLEILGNGTALNIRVVKA
ncbi:MAG: DUF2322 family protein [Paracoccaceae bacterium]|uniref:DUF2322 family protein n=1 Tax=Yoonia sp. TaxID=2212373 RepID=UPI0032789A85